MSEVNTPTVPLTLSNVLNELPGLYQRVSSGMNGGMLRQLDRHSRIMQVIQGARDEAEEMIAGQAATDIAVHEAVGFILMAMHGGREHRATHMRNAAMMLAVASAILQGNSQQAAPMSNEPRVGVGTGQPSAIYDQLVAQIAATQGLSNIATPHAHDETIAFSMPAGPPEAVQKEMEARAQQAMHTRKMALQQAAQAEQELASIKGMRQQR